MRGWVMCIVEGLGRRARLALVWLAASRTMGALLASEADAQNSVEIVAGTTTIVTRDGVSSVTNYSHPQGVLRDTLWVDKTTYGLDEKVTIHYRIACIGSDAVDRMVGEWPPSADC